MISNYLAGARPKTLPAALAPVATGSALAYNYGDFSWLLGLLCGLVSIFLQIGTNYVNDYADGQRGTDGASRVGPKRLVGSGAATSGQVKAAAAIAFLLAAVSGLILVAEVGIELLPVGVLSIAAGWAYTGGPKPYAYYGFGELFVFIFFGLVATVGTFYVHTETFTIRAFILGSVMGALSVALLVTNNLRDIEGDKASGKQTLAVRIGDQRTRWLYVIVILLAASGVIVLSLSITGAILGLMGFIVLFSQNKAVMQGAIGEELILVLSATGLGQVLVGLGLTIGIALW